jgi:hypothetical protein
VIVVLAIARARDAKRSQRDAKLGGYGAVAVKSIAAIVKKRRAAPDVTEAALKAQASALAALESRGLSFLPVRFGTVARDEAELTRLLEPLAGSLAKALALTRGRRQMTVRVRGRRPKTPRSSGRAFLEARAREARVPQADPVRRAVRKFVVAEATGPARGPYSGAVYHLIDSTSVEPYLGAMAALQRRSPKRYVLTGPMPPFAFTSVADIKGRD